MLLFAVVAVALCSSLAEAVEGVAAGVYIYQVEIDGQVEAKKTTKLP